MLGGVAERAGPAPPHPVRVELDTWLELSNGGSPWNHETDEVPAFDPPDYGFFGATTDFVRTGSSFSTGRSSPSRYTP